MERENYVTRIISLKVISKKAFHVLNYVLNITLRGIFLEK